MSTIYPHPVLHPDTLDYKDVGAYEYIPRRDGQTIIVEHILRESALVGMLAREGKATFYATVSVLGTIFRRTKTIVGESDNLGKITASQKIKLYPFIGSPQIHVQAGVVAHEEVEVDWATAAEGGLEDFHKAEKIKFPSYALLADGGWQSFYPANALFKLQSDPDYKEGTFKVDIDRLSDTLKIIISLGPKLFDAVEAGDEVARSQVLCAALAKALADIKRVYNKKGERDETDVQLLEKAESLAIYLNRQGIPAWGSDGFDPVLSASLYKPVPLNTTDD